MHNTKTQKAFREKRDEERESERERVKKCINGKKQREREEGKEGSRSMYLERGGK